MVYWSSAAVALLYLLMTPVRLGAAYAGAREKPLRLGVMFWAIRVQIAPKSRARSASVPSGIPPRALLQAARTLLKGLRVERLSLDASIHLPDAAHTALACGLLSSVCRALQASCPSLRLTARVRADFSGSRSCVRAGGILSVRVGHIIRAGTLFLVYLIAGRLQSWINTRSKAS